MKRPELQIERGGYPQPPLDLVAGCRFKGEIEVKGTFRIEGEFEGTIRHPDSLVVGKTGHVKGSIYEAAARDWWARRRQATAEDRKIESL